MRTRQLGALGPASVVSLGGGGIGRVYGHVDKSEALSTIRAAYDAGVTLLDLAPIYGPAEASPEAEELAGRAFGGRLPSDLLVTSKIVLEDPLSPELAAAQMRTSLRQTLKRLHRSHLDVYFLHSFIRPGGSAPVPATIDVDTARYVVRPEFERLIGEGLIRSWGLTATAVPEPIIELLCESPQPLAIQCVTNPLDALGNLWPPGVPGEPASAAIISAAARNGIAVMGVRALAAGALADCLDRVPGPSDPVSADVVAGQAFRAEARASGISAAQLAYQYALSLPDVATIVTGAKTRTELSECLHAASLPPLEPELMRALETIHFTPAEAAS